MIADEPTTALDVTIQAQILDLIARLKQEIGMSVLLITHDLGVVAEICRKVAVMYAGQGGRERRRWASSSPGRPTLTPSAFSTRCRTSAAEGVLKPIPGVVPSLAAPAAGVRLSGPLFPRRRSACGEEPPWREIAPGHHARCWEPLEGVAMSRTLLRAEQSPSTTP